MTTATEPRLQEITKGKYATSIVGIDPSDINRVLLQDGWHSVKACEFVQYTIGQRQSPMVLNKLTPALKFTDAGVSGKTTYVVPLGQIFGLDYNES